MRQTPEEKLNAVLEDNQLKHGQRELISDWVRHLKKSLDTQAVLDRAYIVRDFGLFIDKPFQEANPEDIKSYLTTKLNSVKESSTKCYRFKIQGFYRWIIRHTNLEVNNDVAYPAPKVIEKQEVSKEEKFKNRIKAILTNEIICKRNRKDRKLSQEELKQKYSELLLPEHHLKVLNDFHNYKITSGIVVSDIGFVGKLAFLKRLGLFLGNKKYKEATREDIQNFLQTIQDRNNVINTSYKAHLLDFYRFIYGMFGNEQPRQYPDVVSWLYTRRKKINGRIAKTIIPDSEIKAMLDTCSEQRDRAIISVLRDSSARVGELTNLNINDVNIAEIGSRDGKFKHSIATIKLRGKTGERINQLFWSVSDLRLYLLNHPLKDNPDAPLFIATKESRFGQRLTCVGVNKLLQRAGRRAGIKRHIHAHLFRHTNLTKTSQVLSESELKIHAGWGPSSKMAEVYIHLSNEDVNKKLLKNHGLPIEESESKEETLLKVQICPNHICSFQNPGDARFCLKCGYPLSLKTAVDLKHIKEKEEELHTAVMEKGTAGIDLGRVTDLKEMMYQIIKNDKGLLEKLKEISKDAEKVA